MTGSQPVRLPITFFMVDGTQFRTNLLPDDISRIRDAAERVWQGVGNPVVVVDGNPEAMINLRHVSMITGDER